MSAQVEELILRRRRQVLVHSILYYKMNTNLIPDAVYDGWAQELAELQRQHPEASERVDYHCDAFTGFTGETGFDLPLHDPDANHVASYLMKRCKA